jgi:hypothetical protein
LRREMVGVGTEVLYRTAMETVIWGLQATDLRERLP